MDNRKLRDRDTSDDDDDDDDPLQDYSTPRGPKRSRPGTPSTRRQYDSTDRESVATRSARSGASQLLELTANRSLSSVSVTLANLPVDERNFLVLVEDASVPNVEKFLEEHPSCNINCRDIHGITGLHRAVRNENFEMINFLVSRGNIYVGDTVLHAVELGNTEVVTLLLEGLRRKNERAEFRPVPDSVDFTPDITPLMLAAHLDDFNMVKLLVDRGHKLVRPHPPGCLCGRAECSGNKSKDFAKLEYSKRRYNSYRAVCSPTYICLNSKDVIKTCFKFCSELHGCTAKEAEFAEKYEVLAERLREFVKQLLEQCSSTAEVELLLKQRHMGAPAGAMYPRIYLALQAHQKEFIAHENCQQVLQAAWLDEWQDWRGMSTVTKLLRMILRICLFPFFMLIFLVIPYPVEWLEKYMRPPIHRYILSTGSYLAFLILLFIETNHDRDAKYRGPPRSGLEWAILIYVIGYCWDLFKKFQLQGISTFVSSWWNIYDILNMSLFFSTFGVWYWAYVHAKGLPELTRMEWEWNEPLLIAEGLFGFSTILSFGKLLQIFRVDRSMGPLLISMGKMVFDMVRFLVVYVCIVLSFATGLNHMYETYADQVRANADGSNTTQSDAFMTFPSTAKTLFWALFGLAPAEAPDVVIGNRYANGSIWQDYQFREHKFTQGSGYVMFGMYQVIGVIILLNTLIAVMSNSYQKVEDNSDLEWKFARTQIWIDFFDAGRSLPCPFNIVPTVQTVSGVVNRILKKDTINTKEALIQRQLALRYSELQGRLIQTVFGKIERDKANDQLSDIQKSLQKVMQHLQMSS
ncbi:Short transient receptor potential channel 5 [Hypsibius exemplaris]|uniref:Short transient receptor potential channel 5 n=1 Tax=Hypsibius exemplaris TaxID=2072580 RepID=A0A1W0XCN7_HYPEX|nr:Short transient receptor potential channel 5 [Hypsibius exemplaris]